MKKPVCQAHSCAEKILNSPDLCYILENKDYITLETRIREDVKIKGAGYLAYDFNFVLSCVAEKLGNKDPIFEDKKVLKGSEILLYLLSHEQNRALRIKYGRRAQEIYNLVVKANKEFKESLILSMSKENPNYILDKL